MSRVAGAFDLTILLRDASQLVACFECTCRSRSRRGRTRPAPTSRWATWTTSATWW